MERKSRRSHSSEKSMQNKNKNQQNLKVRMQKYPLLQIVRTTVFASLIGWNSSFSKFTAITVHWSNLIRSWIRNWRVRVMNADVNVYSLIFRPCRSLLFRPRQTSFSPSPLEIEWHRVMSAPGETQQSNVERENEMGRRERVFRILWPRKGQMGRESQFEIGTTKSAFNPFREIFSLSLLFLSQSRVKTLSSTFATDTCVRVVINPVQHSWAA